MKRLLTVALTLLILSQIAVADDKSVVEALVKSNLDAVLSVLQNKELEQQAKVDKATEIVTPMFDFLLMSKLALGREHWTGLTEEKQERFVTLFRKLLKESYMENLTRYTNETVAVQEAVLDKNRIYVPTGVISKNNTISMLYKFYKSKETWLIYDIEIQDVSIIKSYRTQFDHSLSSGTIDDLFQEMENPKKK